MHVPDKIVSLSDINFHVCRRRSVQFDSKHCLLALGHREGQDLLLEQKVLEQEDVFHSCGFVYVGWGKY